MFLASHDNSGWDVLEHDAAGSFVDFLSAFSAAGDELFRDVVLKNTEFFGFFEDVWWEFDEETHMGGLYTSYCEISPKIQSAPMMTGMCTMYVISECFPKNVIGVRIFGIFMFVVLNFSFMIFPKNIPLKIMLIHGKIGK